MRCRDCNKFILKYANDFNKMLKYKQCKKCHKEMCYKNENKYNKKYPTPSRHSGMPL